MYARCWVSTVRKMEVDSLFWVGDLDHLLHGVEWIRWSVTGREDAGVWLKLTNYDTPLIFFNFSRTAWWNHYVVLFDLVINSRWFLRTSIILLLTKIDVFRNKLPKVCSILLVLWWSSWSLSPWIGTTRAVFPWIHRWRRYQQSCQVHPLEVYASE